MARQILILVAIVACVATAMAATTTVPLADSVASKEKLDTANSIGYGYGLYNGGYGGALSYAHPGYAGYGAYGLGYGGLGYAGAGYPGYTAGYGGYSGYNGYYGGLGYNHGLSGVYYH